MDDIPESHHLTRLADASLEDSHFRLFIKQPHGERHPDLGIIAAGRAHNLLRRQEQLIEPLFDHRLTIGAGDAYNRHIKLIAMTLCQTLKSSQRMGHTQEISFRKAGLVMLRHLFNDKMMHPATVEVVDITMAIITLGFQRKEQSFLREAKTTAICQ